MKIIFSKSKPQLEKYVWFGFSLVIIFLPLIMASGLFYAVLEFISEGKLKDLFFTSIFNPGRGQLSLLPFISGTLLVTFLSLIFALPLALGLSIYLFEYIPKKLLTVFRSLIDIIAGLPSVIFGLWGMICLVPFIRDFVAPLFGLETTGYCLLSASLVLSFMVLPILVQIILEVFYSVPNTLRETGYALGINKFTYIKKILLRKTRTGILAAIVLAFSRAFGETLAVLMVIGGIPEINFNPLFPGSTLPTFIANNYGELSSVPIYKRLILTAAFILFIIVSLFTLFSRILLKRLKKGIE